jgi:hypothetical protein
LKNKSFRGWPSNVEETDLTEEYRSEKDGMTFAKYSFNSQSPFRIPLYLVHRSGLAPADLDLVVLNVLDDKGWGVFLSSLGGAFPDAFPGIKLPGLIQKNYEAETKMHRNLKWGMAYVPPRGIGPTAWTSDKKEATQIRRRFALLGQSLDGMRVWDIRRGIQALRTIEGMNQPKLWIQSSGAMGVNSLYAALYEPAIERLDLHDPTVSHREGPEYLNVLRFVDIPEVMSYVAKNSKVRIYTEESGQWKYPIEVAAKFKWEGKPVEVRKPTGD